jgi:hypothetical protein
VDFSDICVATIIEYDDLDWRLKKLSRFEWGENGNVSTQVGAIR